MVFVEGLEIMPTDKGTAQTLATCSRLAGMTYDSD
jgi:hypothetical protein